ncbi:unnamed protein product [Macrosiphum euphorbiae]|uniref:Ig-like domain-containing protein n=1 Tax=Macrosiphum euphorbiae TaxID=13131 RepID=A0AAV0Y2C0_9HEMI|nr:unnamed protein product [Macrosiphum euphorbiae]
MKIVYGVLSMLCFNLAYSQMTPVITHISPNQIKDIGGATEMACTVSNASNYYVLWMKLDLNKSIEPLLISFKNTLNIKDSRLSIIQDSMMDEIRYTLQIYDIQEFDTGIYRCQIVIGLHNIISAEVELKVRGPPMIHENSTASMVVMEGQQVTLECYARGYPSPRIYWKRENNGILLASRSIFKGNIWKIPAIRKEDRGSYTCIAANGYNKPSQRRIAIQVEFAPIITVPKRNLGQSLHNDMDISCNVEAYPSPAIIWINNNIQLSNNQHYRLVTTYLIVESL